MFNIVLRICSLIFILWGVSIVPLWGKLAAVFQDSPVEYISSNFENASPLLWEFNPDGSVSVHIQYDHERNTVNRASNHVHFMIQAKPGSDVTVNIQYFEEVWNAKKVASYSLIKNYYISEDGIKWTTIPAEKFENGHKIKVCMNTNRLYVAGMEPYRISDLDRLLNEIRNNPLVSIDSIGETVEGRRLEIIKIGHENAPFRVFIRARAHPWEAGGNWVVQGLIKSLLDEKDDKTNYLDTYCVYVLPMANKDGVNRGLTRFNSNGIDLNRGMNLPADAILAPENYALETWLKKMIKKGMKPHVSIDVHNDRNGKLSFGNPSNVRKNEYQSAAMKSMFSEGYLIMDKNVNLDQYNSNIRKFESLMYKHTWYTWMENTIRKDATNSGNYNVPRYNVDISGILELNQVWINGLDKAPFGSDWELLGKQLTDVFYYYFDDSTRLP